MHRNSNLTHLEQSAAAVAPARGRTEAANIRCLGRHAFVYAMLLALGNVGILCLLTVAGIPLEGQFGGFAIIRMLFCGMAVFGTLLSIYAYAWNDGSVTERCRVASAQLLAVSVVFAFFGIDYGDITTQLLDLLRWIGSDCRYCSALP